jgi:methionine-rich copper-binding protein CopC
VRRRAVAAVAVILGVVAALTGPASGHTAMLRGSPDRDAVVGGSIAFVDLEFLDPVSETSVAVTYNGVTVPGRATVAEGELITFVLDEPLVEPGRYQVSYEMVSSDGDFTTGGYFFTFDPAAPAAPRIEASGSGGLPTAALAVAGVGLAVVAALLAMWWFRGRTDRERYEPVEEATYQYDYDSWDGT